MSIKQENDENKKTKVDQIDEGYPRVHLHLNDKHKHASLRQHVHHPSKSIVMVDDEGKLIVRAIYYLATESGDMEFAEHGARLLESVRCIDPSIRTFDMVLSNTNTSKCDVDYIWRALHVFLKESGDTEDRELGASLLAWPGWQAWFK